MPFERVRSLIIANVLTTNIPVLSFPEIVRFDFPSPVIVRFPEGSLIVRAEDRAMMLPDKVLSNIIVSSPLAVIAIAMASLNDPGPLSAVVVTIIGVTVRTALLETAFPTTFVNTA